MKVTSKRDRRVVLTDSLTTEVTHNLGICYSEQKTLDVYYPPASLRQEEQPLVLLVTGYSDNEYKRTYGMCLKDTNPYTSWSELLAARGMVAVVCETDPSELDIPFALEF